MEITPARQAALVDSLLYGDIWARTGNGSWGPRFHSRTIINRLVDAGLLTWNPATVGSGYAGGWILTERGRSVTRFLDDKESSASRQHYVDTGEYLAYGDREELNAPNFEVGQVVKNRHSDVEVQIEGYEIVARKWVVGHGWLFDVKMIGGVNDGYVYYDAVINPTAYVVVEPKEERDWELLAPVVAQAATLVALARGDEVVEDYRDGVITAWELLDELVKAGQ